jgi:hypothetical protein
MRERMPFRLLRSAWKPDIGALRPHREAWAAYLAIRAANPDMTGWAAAA